MTSSKTTSHPSDLNKTRPWYTYKDFLIEKYGEALYRIPIDFAHGCPNRNEFGQGGCTFCPEDGARARQTINASSLEEQVQQAIDFARRRYGASRFMAYVQAYTGTFAPLSTQRRLVAAILSQHNFSALSIGTRPDCLSNATLEYLQELDQTIDVWIELGVQTSHDKTLEYINRGHDWLCSQNAILRLASHGLNVMAHVILGLPGETLADILQTAQRLANLPLAGIKLHNLHVIRNTELARQFEESPFPLLYEHDYCELVANFLRYLPSSMPIVRLLTDTPAEDLIAPRWALGKADFLNMLSEYMTKRGFRQGDIVSSSPIPPGSRNDSDFPTNKTSSASNANSFFGSIEEAGTRFIAPSNLSQKLCVQDIRILDIGFGRGFASLAALNVARQCPAQHALSITCLEIDNKPLLESTSIANNLLSDCGLGENEHWLCRCLGSLGSMLLVDQTPGNHRLTEPIGTEFLPRRAELTMLWGDARHSLSRLIFNDYFDCIFLDAGNVQSHCELWTVDFLLQVFKALKISGVLVAGDSSLPVLAGLMNAGFWVSTPVLPETFHRVAVAKKGLAPEASPLGTQVWHKLRQSSLSIPYRDPQGVLSRKEILRTRAQEVTDFKARLAAENKLKT